MRPQRAPHAARLNKAQRLSVPLLSGAVIGTIAAGLGTHLISAEPGSPTIDHAQLPASQPQPISITVSGDLLWHENVFESGHNPDGIWDFSPVFAPMKPIIDNADLAICHEEVPFAPPEGPFSGYPQFQAPPQIAQGVAQAGWDLCTTASNHSVDGGFPGIQRTMDAFQAAGIMTSGTSRTPEEDATPRIVTTASGVKVAVVNGTYGTNGLPVEEPWMVQDLNPDTLLAKAKTAREAGADIVMAAIHAGNEGDTEPTEQQTELAHILTASPDIDVVYGHHAHAVQPIEKVNGKWVVYGLGNMVASQLPDNFLAYDGLTVRFTFAPTDHGRWEISRLDYIPTIISAPKVMPVTVSPISSLINMPDADLDRIHQSRQRTVDTVLSRGAGADPVVHEG
ncbi:CapA family protein [Corynebacterium poyangense]|uniref:CapA family protein n=1 Tax=Corynebacterium poyangense TaxID=2684405 RepID=A0A7H0SQW9_9CORY|nr:CapA family protein [Corynebacterium poyangense]QNQ90944.1 CapA family protein [Corynebacterium poyangense]